MDTSKLLIEFIIGIFLLPKRINANFSHFLATNGMRKNAKFLAKKIRHFAGSPIPNVFFYYRMLQFFNRTVLIITGSKTMVILTV